MNRFRIHHIMCTNLYRGYGYSGAFCENMSEKVKWLLDNPDDPIMCVCGPDMICAACPNLEDGDYCTNGDNHVCTKDRELLAILRIEENGIYTYNELRNRANMYLTEEAFIESCHTCRWYKEGICKYEDFSFNIIRRKIWNLENR